MNKASEARPTNKGLSQQKTKAPVEKREPLIEQAHSPGGREPIRSLMLP